MCCWIRFYRQHSHSSQHQPSLPCCLTVLPSRIQSSMFQDVSQPDKDKNRQGRRHLENGRSHSCGWKHKISQKRIFNHQYSQQGDKSKLNLNQRQTSRKVSKKLSLLSRVQTQLQTGDYGTEKQQQHHRLLLSMLSW